MQHLPTAALLFTFLFAALSNGYAQPGDASCIPVVNALRKLNTVPSIMVKGQVQNGVHPEGYTTMESSWLNRAQQIRVLDGVRFTSPLKNFDQETNDQVTGAAELLPDSLCERVDPSKPLTSELVEYTYSTIVARTNTYIRIWISTKTGLPTSVHIDGPQLTYGRSLSRPGKPPQAILKANGLRYAETRQFFF
jgi:hypothetical protein